MNTLKYYQKNYKKIFDSVENPNWKIWKIIDEKGLCHQNKTQITSPQRLLKFIKQYQTQKLYVSISSFLNPHKNKGFFANQREFINGRYYHPQKGYMISDCILLDSNFFIDLDSEDDLKIAQKDARKIITRLKNIKGLKLKEINFSGTKGVHLLYKHNIKLKEDPIERIKQVREEKNKIAQKIMKLKLKTIDKTHLNIMINPFAVRSVPNSIKPNGNKVITLDPDDFMNKDIYSLIPPKVSEGAIPMKNKVACAKNKPLASQLYQEVERASLSSSPILFKFVDSMVNGLKDTHVLIMKKHIDLFKIQQLMKLQKQYKMSDLHIIQLGEYYYILDTKLYSYERVMKIMKAFKSDNMRFFMSRKHAYLPLTNTFTEEGIEDRIGYIKRLNGDNECWHSKFHSNLFAVKYQKMTGNNNNIGVMRQE